MNYIVGDIGNTSTRICLLNKNFLIVKSVIFDTKKIYKKKYFRNTLKKFLKKELNKKFLFSSVVPSALKEIKNTSVKIAVDSVKKILSTSVDQSKLDNLFDKNLEESKELLKKINS